MTLSAGAMSHAEASSRPLLCLCEECAPLLMLLHDAKIVALVCHRSYSDGEALWNAFKAQAQRIQKICRLSPTLAHIAPEGRLARTLKSEAGSFSGELQSPSLTFEVHHMVAGLGCLWHTTG